MSAEVTFELCAESVASCIAAHEGGAHRIELCSAIRVGGVTPSHALIQAAVQQGRLPVFVLLRPRAGSFVYSEAEVRLMEADLERAKDLGAHGFVAGVLTGEGRVHVSAMRRLVALAGGLEVTFHRAFDTLKDLDTGLEEVIDSGCGRLLTSGGAPDVCSGAKRLRALAEQSRGRIVVTGGGGLRTETAAELVRATGLRSFHGSLQRAPGNTADPFGFGAHSETAADDVRAMMTELRRGVPLA